MEVMLLVKIATDGRRLFSSHLLRISIFGKHSIRCFAFFMYITSHDDIFAFISPSLILKRLRVSYKQSLPTTWLPLWLIICSEFIFLHSFVFFFQWLTNISFFFISSRSLFRSLPRTKVSRGHFASPNIRLNGNFDCVIGRRSFY